VIRENLKKIRDSVGKEVKIVAVTKKRSIDEIKEALNCGITDIGENKIQEARKKLPFLPKNITKHFIGRLQTNKVAEAVRLFDVIQSVDSPKLAQKINSECLKIGKKMPVFIQVNTSGEPQKGGVKPEDMDELISKIADLPNIRVEGLMTIAIDSDNVGEVGKCFKLLKELGSKLTACLPVGKAHSSKLWLSMGMTDDYKIAIEEGANMVRIGRGIFDN